VKQIFLLLFSICDIEGGAEEADGFSIFVSCDSALGMDIADALVREDDSVLEFIVFVLFQGGLDVIVDDLPVFGMDLVQEEFIIGFMVFGIEAKYVIDFVGQVKFTGEGVPVPVTEAGDAFGGPEPGFALVEGLFVLFSFGDVSDHDEDLVLGDGDDSGFSPSFLVMDVEGIFEGSHFLGGEGLFDGGEDLIGQVPREGVGEVFSDDILFAPDEIEAFDEKDFFEDAVSADADDHIGDGLEDELVGTLGLPEVLLGLILSIPYMGGRLPLPWV